MSKPLYEYISKKAWNVLSAIVVFTVIGLFVIGVVNTSRNYIEPVNPLYDPFYNDRYEGSRPDFH